MMFPYKFQHCCLYVYGSPESQFFIEIIAHSMRFPTKIVSKFLIHILIESTLMSNSCA